MKLTDVRSLPVTDDDNTMQDLDNMCQWGILPAPLRELAARHQMDQFNAIPAYTDRFTGDADGEQTCEAH